MGAEERLQSVAAVVVRDGDVLIVRHARRQGLELPATRVGGLWETGEGVETDADALARCLRRETSLALTRVVAYLGRDLGDEIECRFYLCEAEGNAAASQGATEVMWNEPAFLAVGTWALSEPMAEAGVRVSLGGAPPPCPTAGIKRARQAARRYALRSGGKWRGGTVAAKPPPATPSVPPVFISPSDGADLRVLRGLLSEIQLRKDLGHFDPIPVVEPAPEPPRRNRGLGMGIWSSMLAVALAIDPDGGDDGRRDARSIPWLTGESLMAATASARRLRARGAQADVCLCVVRTESLDAFRALLGRAKLELVAVWPGGVVFEASVAEVVGFFVAMGERSAARFGGTRTSAADVMVLAVGDDLFASMGRGAPMFWI